MLLPYLTKKTPDELAQAASHLINPTLTIMKSTTELTMTRQPVQVPVTQEDWFNLPADFEVFMNQVDNVREQMDSSVPYDPLYPSYEYSWCMDETIAVETLVYYWNEVDQPLPDATKIVEEITSAMGEADYDAYVASAYSY